MSKEVYCQVKGQKNILLYKHDYMRSDYVCCCVFLEASKANQQVELAGHVTNCLANQVAGSNPVSAISKENNIQSIKKKEAKAIYNHSKHDWSNQPFM